MSTPTQRTALITGASRGIGRATAQASPKMAYTFWSITAIPPQKLIRS
jgi:short-subunit dehydrogenase